MRSGRNSSHQSHRVVAILLFLLVATAAFSFETTQSTAMTAEERRARAAVEKFVAPGKVQDNLNAALDLTHELNGPFPGKPYDSYNTGIADGLKDMANIKAQGQRIPPAYLDSLARILTDVIVQAGTQRETNLKSYFAETPSAERAFEKLSSVNINIFIRNINKDIKSLDASAPEQEPAPGGQGKQYDPAKSVGLEGPAYRDMLQAAAPMVDHLLANADVDQSMAQTAAALERAAMINKSMESSRKLPDLVVKSVAAEARTLSPEGIEAMRGELQKLVRMGNPKVDDDEINGAIDTVVAAAKNGVNPNTAAFEKASAALKGYVADALRNAETASTASGAGRKGGAQ